MQGCIKNDHVIYINTEITLGFNYTLKNNFKAFNQIIKNLDFIKFQSQISLHKNKEMSLVKSLLYTCELKLYFFLISFR